MLWLGVQSTIEKRYGRSRSCYYIVSPITITNRKYLHRSIWLAPKWSKCIQPRSVPFPGKRRRTKPRETILKCTFTVRNSRHRWQAGKFFGIIATIWIKPRSSQRPQTLCTCRWEMWAGIPCASESANCLKLDLGCGMPQGRRNSSNLNYRYYLPGQNFKLSFDCGVLVERK